MKNEPESQSSAEVSSAASVSPDGFACGGLRYFNSDCEEVGQGCVGHFRRTQGINFWKRGVPCGHQAKMCLKETDPIPSLQLLLRREEDWQNH